MFVLQEDTHELIRKIVGGILLQNLFVWKTHVLDRLIKQQYLAYHFKVKFVLAILSLLEAIDYLPSNILQAKWAFLIFNVILRWI
jgi:hypothetical protein